ncbi:MAG: hypothetical protein PHC50_04255 [Candidatus Cloacimonetes bacterium]|nr:hypothetical protein [Candidatus Cloacimonadota bacterium]
MNSVKCIIIIALAHRFQSFELKERRLKKGEGLGVLLHFVCRIADAIQNNEAVPKQTNYTTTRNVHP